MNTGVISITENKWKSLVYRRAKKLKCQKNPTFTHGILSGLYFFQVGHCTCFVIAFPVQKDLVILQTLPNSLFITNVLVMAFLVNQSIQEEC